MWKTSTKVSLLVLFIQMTQADRRLTQTATDHIGGLIQPEIPKMPSIVPKLQVLESLLFELLEKFFNFANQIKLPDLSFNVGSLKISATKGYILDLNKSLLDGLKRISRLSGGRGLHNPVHLDGVRVNYDKFTFQLGDMKIVRKLKLSFKENWLALMISLQRRLQCPLQFGVPRIIDNPLVAKVARCKFCPTIIRRIIQDGTKQFKRLLWDPIRSAIFWFFGLFNNSRGWVCFKRKITIPKFLFPSLEHNSENSTQQEQVDVNHTKSSIEGGFDTKPPLSSSSIENYPYTFLPEKDRKHIRSHKRREQVDVNHTKSSIEGGFDTKPLWRESQEDVADPLSSALIEDYPTLLKMLPRKDRKRSKSQKRREHVDVGASSSSIEDNPFIIFPEKDRHHIRSHKRREQVGGSTPPLTEDYSDIKPLWEVRQDSVPQKTPDTNPLFSEDDVPPRRQKSQPLNPHAHAPTRTNETRPRNWIESDVLNINPHPDEPKNLRDYLDRVSPESPYSNLGDSEEIVSSILDFYKKDLVPHRRQRSPSQHDNYNNHKLTQPSNWRLRLPHHFSKGFTKGWNPFKRKIGSPWMPPLMAQGDD